RILVARFLDLERNVAFGFLEETIADDAARDLVAFRAGERRIVDDEGHGDGRRVDRLGLEGFGYRRVAERVGDGALGEAGDGDDVARMGFFDGRALDAAEGEDLRDTAAFDELAVLA